MQGTYSRWKFCINQLFGPRVRNKRISRRIFHLFKYLFSSGFIVLIKKCSNFLETFPNPFSSEIRFEIITQKSSNIRLEIFDHLGRRIKALEVESGTHSMILWDGKGVAGEVAPDDIYYYYLSSGKGVVGSNPTTPTTDNQRVMHKTHSSFLFRVTQS